MFRRRINAEFDRKDIQTLRLREFQTGNRLTIDHKNKRIDIGAGIGEVEREWLFDYIQSKFDL